MRSSRLFRNAALIDDDLEMDDDLDNVWG